METIELQSTRTVSLHADKVATKVARLARHGFVTVDYTYTINDTVVTGSTLVAAIADPILRWFTEQYFKSEGICRFTVRRPRAAKLARVLSGADHIDAVAA